MAGLGEAGLGESPESSLAGAPLLASVSSRQHFITITWLRWRIFRNSLHGRGAAGELAVKILSYPFLAVMILGPTAGAGFAGYYLVHNDLLRFLPLPLWIIFALWQFLGASTSATGPSFDLSSLIRFPIRYRDYLLIRLSFGLLDPPTVAGICCLLAMTVGIAIADLSLFPWAAILLAIYAVCNIIFSRVVYSWLERWMARRRTRELLTGVILLFSLGVQFAGQFAQRLGFRGSHGHHAPMSPFVQQVMHVGVVVNWLLPPGLAAGSIEQIHSGSVLLAVASLAGLLLFTVGFFLILDIRLRAQYRGENLSEAAGAAKSKSMAVRGRSGAGKQTSNAGILSFLPATVAACLVKEIRYLLRSGPKLYTLILPVFMVFLFSMRTSGMNYMGVPKGGTQGMLFSYGCAYMQLIFAALIYNSLGGDGAGVQFYFIAPLRMRDVILAKNLMTFGIFTIEGVLIYIGSSVIASRAPADITVATIAWSLFVIFLNMSMGNVRSISSPRLVDANKMRSQNASGMNGLISLVVVAASVGLGVVSFVLCKYLHLSLWIAAGAFFGLAALAFTLYIFVLSRLDRIAAGHVENLTRVLSKA